MRPVGRVRELVLRQPPPIDFILQPAGFAIGETLIPFDSSESYLKAYLVGLGNTLRVALAGIVLATVLGTLVGIGRVSSNALARGLCYVYTELLRNVPILLQLLMWYVLLVEWMPDAEAPLQAWDSVFLSKGGLALPWLAWDEGAWTSRLLWELPALVEGEVRGGLIISPEFLAVTLGLTLYTSAFVAEIVRSGILALHKGQSEAASALGLSRGQVMRLVLLPQALRVIVPPMTSQYLNITKNSSLAIAIGYPDLVASINVTINQTGQAIENILIIMAAYLSVSLSISLFMNWYNKRIALVER